jgi:glucose/arabinose dehydrogenase
MVRHVSPRRLASLMAMVMLFLTINSTIPMSQIQYSHGSTHNAIIHDPELAVEEIVTGLEFPTSMAFLGQDDILVAEKNTGKIQRIVNGILMHEPLLDLNVANRGERGMLGIAISTILDSGNHDPISYVFVYCTMSLMKDGEDYGDTGNATEPLGNRLFRYELADNHSKLVSPRLLLDLPASPGPLHNGGVIKIRNNDEIYVAVGDVRTPGNIQTVILNKTVAGILRITADGIAISPSILKGKESLNKYYAYGIRNSFGMDFDPISGKLWDTENGQSFGDEINMVEPGFNSGWRKVQGIWMSEGKTVTDRYLDMALQDYNGEGKYRTPELTWNSSAGLTALSFLRSGEYGRGYENDMFVAEFHNGTIYHFDLNEARDALSISSMIEDKIVYDRGEIQNHVFGEGFGGITDLEVNPYDGFIYVLSFDKGSIYRIVPRG